MNGLVKGDFDSWKHHPVSKVYLKFLEDYRTSLLNELITSFEAGVLIEKDEKEIRGRTLILKDLIDLQFSNIQAFYGVEPNATEVDPD